MSLYANAQALDAEPRKAGARQAVITTTEDPSRYAELATLVEAALPNATLNRAAIEKNGMALDGSGKMVPYAVTQKVPVKASVTFHASGKVVWAGIDPIALA